MRSLAVLLLPALVAACGPAASRPALALPALSPIANVESRPTALEAPRCTEDVERAIHGKLAKPFDDEVVIACHAGSFGTASYFVRLARARDGKTTPVGEHVRDAAL